MMSSGGDVNLCSRTKRASPLFEASKQGWRDCVITLLRHKADPHLNNCDGILPIHTAAANGDIE